MVSLEETHGLLFAHMIGSEGAPYCFLFVQQTSIIGKGLFGDVVDTALFEADSRLWKVDNAGTFGDDHVAGILFDEAGRNFHERGFAGAVGAGQCRTGAVLQVERRVTDEVAGTKRQRNPAQLNKCHSI